MKKIILTLSLMLVVLLVSAQSAGHLFVEIKKAGLECPLKNGLVLKDSVTIHIPVINVTFDSIVHDSITINTKFHVFQDTTMYIAGGKPQFSPGLNALKTARFDKDGFTFTSYWTGYLREELKTLFGVENTDINLIKR